MLSSKTAQNTLRVVKLKHPYLRQQSISASAANHEHHSYFQPRSVPSLRPVQEPFVTDDINSNSDKSTSAARIAARTAFTWVGVFSTIFFTFVGLGNAYLWGKIPGADPGEAGQRHQKLQKAMHNLQMNHYRSQGAATPTIENVPESGEQSADPESSSETEALKALVSSTAYIQELNRSLAVSQEEVQFLNYSKKRTYRLLVDAIFNRTHVVRDVEIIQNPPVEPPKESGINESNAAMLRLVDSRTGKDRALILGLDESLWTQGQDSLEVIAAALHWLQRLSIALYMEGKAVNDCAIPLYLWHRDMIVEGAIESDSWSSLKLKPSEMPPRFPMAQMRCVPLASKASNRAVIDTQKSVVQASEMQR